MLKMLGLYLQAWNQLRFHFATCWLLSPIVRPAPLKMLRIVLPYSRAEDANQFRYWPTWAI